MKSFSISFTTTVAARHAVGTDPDGGFSGFRVGIVRKGQSDRLIPVSSSFP